MLPNKQIYGEKMLETEKYLKDKKKVLFLTTSNRWSGDEDKGEIPKSTKLAMQIQKNIGKDTVTLLDVSKLKIYPCEGNVSTKDGNSCGVKGATLDDTEKNPSGELRCWASMNNEDDELWKVAKILIEADAVVFFTSVRWGQTNSFYQKLIERLTWLENRHSNLGEENILKGKDSGIIIINQNWRGKEVMETQKDVLGLFGFDTPDELTWYWQYTQDSDDEDDASYKDAYKQFQDTFIIDKK